MKQYRLYVRYIPMFDPLSEGCINPDSGWYVQVLVKGDRTPVYTTVVYGSPIQDYENGSKVSSRNRAINDAMHWCQQNGVRVLTSTESN